MESVGQKLPAVKMFLTQLDGAVETPNAVGEGELVAFNLCGVAFARVWIQGVVVDVHEGTGSFIVDDSTDTIVVSMADKGGSAAGVPPRGRYVLLVGAVEAVSRQYEQMTEATCRRYRLLIDVIKDVGAEGPDRETMWALEVVDFWASRHRRLDGSV